MPKNPPENMPRVTPAVFYDDPAAALDWLAKAFGFKTRLSVPGPEGKIVHAEMQIADGVIMLGPASMRAEWKSPRSLGGAITQSIYVYVDDVDAHFARACDAGAKIISEPKDQFYGDRNYEVQDHEGHRWVFGQHIKDVDWPA
jgi:uncharacterized glyoxalase superfamily protein PhnB